MVSARLYVVVREFDAGVRMHTCEVGLARCRCVWWAGEEQALKDPVV